MAKKYNYKLIKTKRSYSTSEIAKLLGVDRKTCTRWIKYEGLRVIMDNTKPLLVMGADLQTFIVEKVKSRKTKLKDNEFFCVKCQKAVKAKEGSIQLIDTGKTIGKKGKKQLNKVGICEFCSTKLNRFT